MTGPNSYQVIINEYSSIYTEPIDYEKTLYVYQRNTIMQMANIEDNNELENNKGVLSLPVGSGKTIITLAFLTNFLVSKPRKIIYNHDYNTRGILVKNICSLRTIKKEIKSCLIVVGSPVYNQWKREITESTKFKCMYVYNVRDFRKLMIAIDNETISEYDIVLMKFADMSGKMDDLPSDYSFDKNMSNMDILNCKKTIPYLFTKNMLDILSNFHHHTWNRIIYDDVDALKIKKNTYTLNAYFTWYISSTNKCNTYNSKIKLKSLPYDTPPLFYQLPRFLLNSMVRIRIESNYMKNCSKMTPIYTRLVGVKCSNDSLINIIKSLDTEFSNGLCEMINGDAISSAAEQVGIKTNSVVDIFKKVLGSEFNNYRLSGDVVAFIDYQIDNKDEWEEIDDDADLDLVIDDCKVYRYGIKDVENFRDIEYKYPNIEKTLDTCKDKHNKIIEKSGLAIQRIKDNIKGGSCPICRISLSECDEFTINTCCQIICCNVCGFSSQKIVTNRGVCANCRKPITDKNLIYIGDKINLDNIEDEVFDEEEEELENNNPDNSIGDKYKQLIDIINSVPDIKYMSQNTSYRNVMGGDNNLPFADTRKILVFANYDETLEKTATALNNSFIKYERLFGTSKNIDTLANKFNTTNKLNVLLINSTKYCNGLNLQNATDIVFMHKINNEDIESQVVGRAQRLGRTSPLVVWKILYNTE